MTRKLHIGTNRLLLRNLQANDLADFHAYRSDPEVTRYQGFDVMDEQECREFIRAQTEKEIGVPGEWVQYGIEEITTGSLVGDCAIRLDSHDIRIAELGITLGQPHQQKGFAKESLSGILHYLFNTCGVLRIVAIVDTENSMCVKLLEGIGFKREGHLIENIFFKGKWGSEYLYAMLKREWVKCPQNLS